MSSMQVSVENVNSLKRRMTVKVPNAELTQEIDNRFKRLARTAKVDGFRPGKVPTKILQQQYGPAVRDEAINQLISKSLGQAFQQENLAPAGRPTIESIKDDMADVVEYVASFEVFPDIKLADFKGTALTKIVAEITDADVAEVIEKLRKQYATWKDSDVPAADGDRVTIDCEGSLDGQVFNEGTAKDMKLVLGSKSTIPGFEDGLLGAKSTEQRVLDLVFPKDYHNTKLAGQKVQFTINVKKVEKPQLPELNDELAKQLHVKSGDIAGLQSEVKTTLERELNSKLANTLKQQVMEALLKQNVFDVPHSLVHEETHQLQHQMQDRMKAYGNKQLPEMPLEMFEKQAERRVKLGLLLPEIVKLYDLKLDDNKVKELLQRIAESYEDPEELAQWYYQDKNRLAELQAVAMEEQLVDKLVELATVTEKKMSYTEAMNFQANEAAE